MRKLIILTLVAFLAGCAVEKASWKAPGLLPDEAPSTFSIVAHDPETGDLGIAVQSRFFGVGAVVPWLSAGVGAIATQSYANTLYGPRGLELLASGLPPADVLKKLTEDDAERDFRQVGIVDSRGRSASFTGKRCLEWAGARSGDGFSVQGNILVSQATVDAMARAYAEARGELAERLVLALEAGQRAGGDARGRQSAAVVVARKGAGYGGFNDRYVDLRVDDHPSPLVELRRLVEIQVGKDPVSRARRLEHQGHVEEAAKILREALSREPGLDAARFELARLLLAAGKGDEGRSELVAAVARAPDYDHYHFHAAQILARAGLAEECLAEVKRTLEINPEYAAVFRREVESSVSPFRQLKERIETLLRS
ncbi:MAG TPA: DUF1028 domain-containing protein [Planctomycetota bacterium]|nr:DUF1028 domain-containing protein [Planctomycetota bacterium]